MRVKFTRDIQGNEVLADNIISAQGKIILKKGTKLTLGHKMYLINHGIYVIYIKDNAKGNEQIEELKISVLRNIPDIFNNILENRLDEIEKGLTEIEKLIDYIIEQKSINVNLFEVKTYDNYTYIHCVDTGIMATYLGLFLKFDHNKIRELGMAGMFHDIGKLKIPNELINKKAKLTDDEFEEIKKHTIYSGQILRESGIFSEDIIMGVLQHHERYDGSGYPFGLRGNEICEFAKVISICDVFTAISSGRSYREKFKPTEAYEYILSNGNKMFDINYVKKFKQVFSIYPLGCKVMLSDGEEGYVVKQNKNFPDRPVIKICSFKDHEKKDCDIDLLHKPNIIIKDTI